LSYTTVNTVIFHCFWYLRDIGFGGWGYHCVRHPLEPTVSPANISDLSKVQRCGGVIIYSLYCNLLAFI